MQLVEFFAQRRSLQDRVIACLRGQLAPAPMLSTPLRPKLQAPLVGVTGLSLVATTVLLVIGYGNYSSSWLRLGAGAMAAIAVLLFVAAFSLVFAFARKRRTSTLPFPPGVYLFPGALIDARSPTMRTFRAEDIASTENVGATVRVSCAGSTYTFVCESPIAAENWRRDIHESMATAKATPQDDRVSFDPLIAPRFDNPLAATEALTPSAPLWTRVPWLPALLAACSMAPLLTLARNAASDAAGANKAAAIGTQVALREYISNGSIAREEFESKLLPRAELSDTETLADMSAMLRFAAKNQRSAIAHEIQAAVKRGYQREFDLAQRKGTLSALYNFAQQYPNHNLPGQYLSAVHEQFVTALARMPKGPLGARWLPALFAHAEQHHGPLDVSVEAFSEKGFATVDQALAKVPEARGETAQPSRYFAVEPQATRDGARRDAILSMLQRHLDPEFVVVGTNKAGNVKATLALRVQTEWSGLAFASRKPRAVVVGIERTIFADLTVGGTPNLPYKKALKHAPKLPREGSEPVEPGVYAVLNDEADAAALKALELELFGNELGPQVVTAPVP
jgi:hypothetical protein